MVILVFEDDLSECIEALNDVDDSMETVLQMQMFFDSPEVQAAVTEILENIRMSRLRVQHVAERFTKRSKRRFELIIDQGQVVEPTSAALLSSRENLQNMINRLGPFSSEGAPYPPSLPTQSSGTVFHGYNPAREKKTPVR
jgi:hypothetical protein